MQDSVQVVAVGAANVNDVGDENVPVFLVQLNPPTSKEVAVVVAVAGHAVISVVICDHNHGCVSLN